MMRDVFTRLLIAVVIFGLAVGAAFGAGTIYGRNSVKVAPGAAAAPLTGGTAGIGAPAVSGTTALGTPGGAVSGTGASGVVERGAGGVELSGTVKSFDGRQFVMTTGTGQEITVSLGGAASVGSVQQSDAGAIKPGASIVVLGQRAVAPANQTGAQDVTASSIFILPQGFTP